MAETMDHTGCPTFILAMQDNYAYGQPFLFRSYRCELFEPSNHKIWQVARASTAAPSFFKPMCCSDSPVEIFVDGGYSHYNPSNFALSEAQKLWPTIHKFCLVSMALGKPTSGTDREKSVYDDALFNNVVLPLIPRARLRPAKLQREYSRCRSLWRHSKSPLSGQILSISRYWIKQKIPKKGCYIIALPWVAMYTILAFNSGTNCKRSRKEYPHILWMGESRKWRNVCEI